jgi:uncharacterized protein (TIGR03067 family)
MRPVACGKLAPLLLAFVLAGCQMNLGNGGPSNNKGKIEGTYWRNQAGSIRCFFFRTDLIRMDFRGDGTVIMQAGPERITGKYELGAGDTVYLSLDKAFAGSKNFSETIVISGGAMVMSDPDGTSITFTLISGPSTTETKAEPKDETKQEAKAEPKSEPAAEPPPETEPEPEPKNDPHFKPDPKAVPLLGRWSINEMTYNGEKEKLDPKECICVITPTRMTLWVKGRVVADATYSCEFTHQPPYIDLHWHRGTFRGRKALGLFLITENMLQIVVADPGQPRPNDLTAPTGAKHEKLVLQRGKSK